MRRRCCAYAYAFFAGTNHAIIRTFRASTLRCIAPAFGGEDCHHRLKVVKFPSSWQSSLSGSLNGAALLTLLVREMLLQIIFQASRTISLLRGTLTSTQARYLAFLAVVQSKTRLLDFRFSAEGERSKCLQHDQDFHRRWSGSYFGRAWSRISV